MPHIDAAMVGVAEDVGRRTYQEDRHTVSQLRSSLLHLIHHLLLLSLLPPPSSLLLPPSTYTTYTTSSTFPTVSSSDPTCST